MRQFHGKHRGSRSISLILTLGVTLSLTAAMVPLHGSEQPGEASAGSARQVPQSRWILRGGPTWVVPTGDEAGDLAFMPQLTAGESRKKSISDDLAFGAELEYLLTRNVGIELTALIGDVGADLALETEGLRSTDSRDIGFTAVTLGVNYHLTPGRRADVYLGAFAQRSDYDDVTHRFPAAGRSAHLTFDEAVGFGVKAGIDVPFRRQGPWILSVAVRHFREPLDVKPVIGSVFIGYRFH